MKKGYTISLLCLIFSAILHAQHIDNNGKINIGAVDSIQSKILNEQRALWVYVPDFAPNSSERFPVLYLLDGDGHFPSVVGMIRQLSTTNGNTVVPKMIVVGIPNTDRMRDLTPTHDASIGPENTSGGGETFLSFISDELIPYIDNNYPTAPYRLFIGHSLGGLTALNALLKYPELFNAYIAIDPSLWWSNSDLLNQAKALLNENNYENETLYVGIANTMEPDMDVNKVVQDTTKMTQHIRDILEFSNTVVPNSSSQLQFDSKYYNNDTHGSVPLISTYDGLRFIFSWYNIGDELIPLIMNPESTNVEVVTILENHYNLVSKNMGYTIKPPEDFINQMGYGCLQNELPKKAEAFFKLNVKNYPNSSNVYDSLGDYYAAVNDNTAAIKAYEKAMSTGGGNGYSQEKLDTLKKEN